MKDISIVTACVDFDDYLNRVIDSWKGLRCHKIIVSTASDDHKTIKLCKDKNLTVVTSPRKNEWIRGYYINAGLKLVDTKWTLILDADCWLPNITINTDTLNKKKLYGLHSMEMTPEQLEDYKYDNKRKCKIRKTTVGVGFFQLFYSGKQKRGRWYSEDYNVLPNGKGASLEFAKKWKKPIKLSDDFVIVISNTKNRFGRKTGRMPKRVYTKGQLIESKTNKFKKFTNYDIGIAIYEK